MITNDALLTDLLENFVTEYAVTHADSFAVNDVARELRSATMALDACTSGATLTVARARYEAAWAAYALWRGWRLPGIRGEDLMPRAA